MARERGASTIPAVVLAALAGLVTAVLLMDWMVVDVRTPEPENIHIKVPFPLLVADIATSFVPDEALEDAEVPAELKAQREVVLAALESLLETPDATLVKVQHGDTLVEISKKGDQLLVSVDADDAVVRCSIPVEGVYEALERWDWQTVDPGLILDVLHEAGSGNLLTVEADGARVAVNMW